MDSPFDCHHGDSVRCPQCGGEFTLICLGRMHNMSSLTRRENVGFIRAADGVLTVSAGVAQMEYGINDLDPWPTFDERARYVIEPGKRQMWRNISTWEKRGKIHRNWQPQDAFTEPFGRTHYFGYCVRRGEVGYVGAENIAKTSMRWCQIDSALCEGFQYDIFDISDGDQFRGVIAYLGEYSAHPQLEMLVKLGHVDVVRALLEGGSLPRGAVNWRAKDPASFFRLSKADYRSFRAVPDGWRRLMDWRKAPTAGLSFAGYMELCAAMPGRADRYFATCAGLGLDCKRVAAWMAGQIPGAGENMDEVCGMWQDYLDAAKKLGRDLTFRRNAIPEDLRQAHDAAVEQVHYAERQAEIKDYGQRYKRLKKLYEFSDGELRIVVPGTSGDIIAEGRALRHCVGGYAQRHIKGQTTILFLRRAAYPEIPYVTIEIEDASLRLRQVHGYRNEQGGAVSPLVTHKEFFDEWREWLRRGSPRTRKGRPIRPGRTEKEVKTA